MTRATTREPETSRATFRVAATAADKARVVALRDAVYVHDQGRLGDAADTAATFDRFDSHALYLLAEKGGQDVGTVKIVRDSPAGLPCEDFVDLGPLRAGAQLVEFGHLMTLPTIRNQTVGMGLMRAALIHSVREFAATHVLGDFFIDDSGGLRSFYTTIGFVPVGEPYADPRFQGAPLSVVAALDLAGAAKRLENATGRAQQLLRYFFHDYPEYRS
jgi:putrescine aminotransferase